MGQKQNNPIFKKYNKNECKTEASTGIKRELISEYVLNATEVKTTIRQARVTVDGPITIL